MDLARMALEQAWQLTALVIVAWLTVRIVAHNRPHLAYMLWLVVLLKAVTPPMWSSPTSVYSWIQASRSHDVQHVRASPETIHDQHPSIVSRQIPAPYERAPESKAEQWTKRTAARLTANSSAPNSSVTPARHVLGGLVVSWCGGLLAALLITTVRWSKCIYLLRVSPAIDRPDLDDLVATLSRELRIRRRVRLLVTTGRIGPAVIGLFRPLIVLPEIVVQGKRADDLKAIIAHELLHVRRGDLWLGLLQVCARAIWWFHPLVWWASRMSTREAERCCDEEVIGELRCDPKRYARSLLEVLELKQTLRTIPAFPGMKPVEVTSQRLERIMRLGQGCHKRTPRWCWAVMLVFAMGVLPGAALVLSTEPLAPSSASVDAKRRVVEKQPRRPNFGGQVNSDVGVAGQIAIDEAYFDVDPQRSVEQRLSQQINTQFTNLPLHEALAVISRQIDLPIEIDLEGVAAEGVTPKQPVSLSIGKASADDALRLLLEPHKLRYSLEGNTVVVHGKSSAPMIAAVYNIADLLEQDLDWLNQPEVASLTPDSIDSSAAEILTASIIERVEPESWSEKGGKGGIEAFLTNQSLVVLQTEPVHRKVDAFLANTRKQLGIISEMPPSPSFRLLRSRTLRQYVSVYPMIYAVADLVIPVPPVRPVLRGPYNLLGYDLLRYGTLPQGLMAADFDTLVDLITSTVVPESWASAGGIGQIEVFPTNLSMVINQSAEVHEQVADLIKQLRRMQDVQISIETQLLRVPKSFLPTDKLPGFVVRDIAELEAGGHQ